MSISSIWGTGSRVLHPIRNKETKRDISLDLFKGIACVLMIFAHSGVEKDGTTRLIAFVGELAPVFFFAVAGITGYIQAEKYRPIYFFAACTLIFVLGLAYNGITQGDFYANFQMEIIQIIAAGTFFVYIIRHVGRPTAWVFLALAVLAFACKVVNEHAVFPGLARKAFAGILFPPGVFPIFPWLYLFFAGVFAYKTNNHNNLGIGLACFLSLPLLWALSFDLRPFDKWNISAGYFLLSTGLLLLLFYLVRKFPVHEERLGLRVLLFLGRYSLLFLFIHKFVIRVMRKSVLAHYPYLFWIIVFAGTLALMRGGLALSGYSFLQSLFQHAGVWLLLVVLVLLAPVVLHEGRALFAAEFLLGAAFATYYPFLTKMVKEPGRISLA